ncbi:Azospirillum phage Cd, Gp10 [uncultured Caudovirales phage]|uniref:Azospirillum phage Cd, Gp10 n=1 Tax=uncultured Caudovirales phage TaxID=2100421 RepID=A0A6J7VQF7_9CAUD|nr:Azospirillum phage Cd, Gp10 [uncultured Caudovirales phage]
MTIGHNSAAADELTALIERVERLEEEKKALAEDIKAVFAEAKMTGFDVKAMRRVLAERKIELAERKERRAMFDLYADKTKLYGDDDSEGDFV